MSKYLERCKFKHLGIAVTIWALANLLLGGLLIFFVDDLHGSFAWHFGDFFFMFLLAAPLLYLNVSNCRIIFRVNDLFKASLNDWLLALSPLLLMVIAIVLFLGLGLETPSSTELTLSDFILLTIISVTIVPVFEEIIFRQILPSILQVNFHVSFWVSAIVCSALFSVVHGYHGIHLLIYGFVIGVCLHLVRFKSGSLLLACVAHGILNFSVSIFEMLGVI